MKDVVENHYEVKTNDPRNKVIKLTLLARLKPLPASVSIIKNASLERGEQTGAFNVWPTSSPLVELERNKSATLSLRIKPVVSNGATLKLAAKTPDTVKLRPEGKAYWLDVAIAPMSESGYHSVPITIESSDGNKINVTVSAYIPDENIVVTPRELDLGETTLADANGNMQRRGRLGVRKLVGAFQIKSLSSTLNFLKLEQQTIVAGSNYLIRIGINPAVVVNAGAYKGIIRIETDEGRILEVPVKITLL